MKKATTSASSKDTTASKTVQVLARYEIKHDRSSRPLVGHVAYLVRSSRSDETYCTTLVQGKATGCTCPSKKPCYHMKQLTQIEAARGTKTNVPSTVALMPQECPLSGGISGVDLSPFAVDLPELPVVKQEVLDSEPLEDEEFSESVAGRWVQEEVEGPLSREAYVSLYDPCYIG